MLGQGKGLSPEHREKLRAWFVKLELDLLVYGHVEFREDDLLEVLGLKPKEEGEEHGQRDEDDAAAGEGAVLAGAAPGGCPGGLRVPGEDDGV
jgi:hypothetical protein